MVTSPVTVDGNIDHGIRDPNYFSVNSGPGISSKSTLVCGKFDFPSLDGNPTRRLRSGTRWPVYSACSQ